jgi:hypothetical protein
MPLPPSETPQYPNITTKPYIGYQEAAYIKDATVDILRLGFNGDEVPEIYRWYPRPNIQDREAIRHSGIAIVKSYPEREGKWPVVSVEVGDMDVSPTSLGKEKYAQLTGPNGSPGYIQAGVLFMDLILSIEATTSPDRDYVMGNCDLIMRMAAREKFREAGVSYLSILVSRPTDPIPSTVGPQGQLWVGSIRLKVQSQIRAAMHYKAWERIMAYTLTPVFSLGDVGG